MAVGCGRALGITAHRLKGALRWWTRSSMNRHGAHRDGKQMAAIRRALNDARCARSPT